MSAAEIIEEEFEEPKKPQDRMAMYLIVRSSLNMSTGKAAAQCGHAVESLYDRYYWLQQSLPSHNNRLSFDSWRNNHNRTKIVLRASEEQWLKILQDIDIENYVVIKDAGYTEIPPNTDTVIGVMPLWKSKAPPCISQLSLLK